MSTSHTPASPATTAAFHLHTPACPPALLPRTSQNPTPLPCPAATAATTTQNPTPLPSTLRCPPPWALHPTLHPTHPLPLLPTHCHRNMGNSLALYLTAKRKPLHPVEATEVSGGGPSLFLPSFLFFP